MYHPNGRCPGYSALHSSLAYFSLVSSPISYFSLTTFTSQPLLQGEQPEEEKNKNWVGEVDGIGGQGYKASG